MGGSTPGPGVHTEGPRLDRSIAGEGRALHGTEGDTLGPDVPEKAAATGRG